MLYRDVQWDNLARRYGLTESIALHFINNLFTGLPVEGVVGMMFKAGGKALLTKQLPPRAPRAPLRNNMFPNAQKSKLAAEAMRLRQNEINALYYGHD